LFFFTHISDEIITIPCSTMFSSTVCQRCLSLRPGGVEIVFDEALPAGGEGNPHGNQIEGEVEITTE